MVNNTANSKKGMVHMNKKLIVGLVIGVFLAAYTLPMTAMAAEAQQYGYGWGGMGGLMWDADGNLLDRDAFEEKLDGAITDGYFFEEDRDYFLEMYDYCAGNGNFSDGYYGGCWGGGYGGGRGRGFGGGCCGRW